MPFKRKRRKKNFVKKIRKDFIIYSVLLVITVIAGMIISLLSSNFSRERIIGDVVAKERGLRQKEADNFTQSAAKLVELKIKEIDPNFKR